MISPGLLALVRCPDCHRELDGPPGRLTCVGCGRIYESPADFLDMRPRETFAEQTKYLDDALHVDARHERVSPPLLGSKIRNDMLRNFLRPAPGELIVDLGCGSGRALLWNQDLGATAIGIDIAPFFSRDARTGIDLLLGDLRRLPFADGTFDKAWSLDVLEHLSPEALAAMLKEAGRILKPGGSLFVYTHVRKNAPIAAGLKWINALARRLEKMDLIDLRQERLRKSDHLNPLRDVPHLEDVVRTAGFRIGKIRYYTPLVGGFVENILARLAERAMARRARRNVERRTSNVERSQKGGTGKGADGDQEAVREARSQAKALIARRGPVYAALQGLSFAMKLDLLLFGRVRSGPFFALLIKE
jgi:SAM-dependent methyltransferase